MSLQSDSKNRFRRESDQSSETRTGSLTSNLNCVYYTPFMTLYEDVILFFLSRSFGRVVDLEASEKNNMTV
jgi:hypothetical protein